MKKTTLVFLLFLCASFSMLAQRTITGTVMETNGDPLIGASVIIKGTTNGTSTDTDGSFSLEVSSDAKELEISFTGFKTQTIAIGVSSVYTVTLEEGKILGEVFVVGYGSQKRSNVSGAISRVEGEDIQGKAVAGLDGALQGKVTGLLLTSNSGQPGGGQSMRIRGNSSINAGNEPLYVIDGIPVTTGDFSENYYGGMDHNVLSDLNPADIESIEVLKDAASASIYGSRASNGVVLITTKKGSAGKAKINFGYSIGEQTDIKRWDMLSGEQYADLTGDPWNMKNADFMGALYRKAPISQYDMSVSGGDLKTKYYIGGSYFDQEGTILGQSFDRLSGRLNFDHTANKWLTLSAGINMAKSRTKVVQSDNNIYGALSLAILQPQNVDIYNEDGTYNFAGMFFENPIATAAEKTNLLTSRRTLANVGAKFQIMEGLSFQSRIGLDITDFNERVYNPVTTSQGAGVNGEAFLNTTSAIRTVYQNFFDYQTNINKIGLGILAGIDYENAKFDNTSLAGTGFPSAEFVYLASAAEYTNAAQDITANSLLSYYTRVNVNILNRYVVTGTFRADGSSKFGANNRYGYFPSISVGWKINNESFLKDVGAISNMKLRVSLGKAGNQAGIGNFASRGLAGGGNNYQGAPGVAPSTLPNPDLKWEETTELNIGLDFGLWEDRLNGSVDYYIKNTNDLLLNRPLPPSSGFTGIDQNVGKMENKGVEIGINGLIIDRVIKWSVGFQIAANDNKVIELFDGQGFDAGFTNRIDEDQPLAYFYGWKSLGVNPQTGDLDFEDINGDGDINGDDYQFIGNPHPDFNGSFKTNVSYKGIYLDVFFNFVQGNEVLNYTRVFNEDGLRRGFNNNTNVLNAWKEAGDVTDVFQIGGTNAAMNGAGTSSHWIEDGSFVRLKTVSLGYNLPSDLLEKIGMSNLKIYVAGENLKTWTDYSGLDPEVNYNGTANLAIGTDFLTQGLNRTIKFGIQGTF